MLANDIRNYRTKDHIAHHGILGMSWGKKNGPPYPLKAGDHSPKEKKAAEAAGVKVGKDSGKGSMENVKKKNILDQIGDKMKADKVAKQRKAALDKAREAKQKKAEEAKAAEQHEADKKKALESGDYKQIQKYANEVSTADLNNAINRADTLARLNQKVLDSTPVEPNTWDKIRDVADKVGVATNAASKGIEAWNKVATVWNTFADVDSMLPELGKNFNETKQKILKERSENERKAAVETITKSNDVKKILENQEMFKNEEIKAAKERLGNIEGLKNIDKQRESAKPNFKAAQDLAGKNDESKEETKKPKDYEDSDFPDDDNSSTKKSSKKNTFNYDNYDFPDDDNGSVKEAFRKASSTAMTDRVYLPNGWEVLFN